MGKQKLGCSFLPRLPEKIERHCKEHDRVYREGGSQWKRVKADVLLGWNVGREGLHWVPLGVIMTVATLLLGWIFYGKRRNRKRGRKASGE